MLRAWEQVPGAGPLTPGNSEFEGDIPFASGQVDAAKLRLWVKEARRLADEAGRLVVCDIEIGSILAYAPIGSDGAWPCEAVRDLLEELRDSDEIRRGTITGVYNKRGTHSREEGGNQERKLEAKFRRWQQQVTARCPVTSRLLGELADGYARDALHEDERSRIEEYEP